MKELINEVHVLWLRSVPFKARENGVRQVQNNEIVVLQDTRLWSLRKEYCVDDQAAKVTVVIAPSHGRKFRYSASQARGEFATANPGE